MELRVNEVQLPEKITFNYEELKQELTAKVSHYETLVYTDDQIKLAKNDRANLNKLKKALNDERIRREKEYMIPFNEFKAQINEIIGIIDKPVSVIDKQVKEYEEKQKQDKLQKINEYMKEAESNLPDDMHIPINDKWLNASVSFKSITDEINARVEQINKDLVTLSNLPEFGFEATEIYKTTLDINKALNEGKRLSEIAKAKAAHEAEMKARAEEQAKLFAETVTPEVVKGLDGTTYVQDADKQGFTAIAPVEPARQWVSFAAYITVEDAEALKQFLESRNIEFKPVA